MVIHTVAFNSSFVEHVCLTIATKHETFNGDSLKNSSLKSMLSLCYIIVMLTITADNHNTCTFFRESQTIILS